MLRTGGLHPPVAAFCPLPSGVRAEIEAEAALLGPIRDCTSVEVAFDA